MNENKDKSYLRAILEEIDSAEDAELLALAEERMKGYNPSKLISQAEIDAEFGFDKK